MNILILFGVTGDLAQKKVLPALSTILTESQDADSVIVFGVGRKKQPPTAFESIVNGRYLDGELDAPAVYERLYASIQSSLRSLISLQSDASLRPILRINVYSSLPPHMHAVVAGRIATYVYTPLREQKEIDLQFHFFVEKPIGVDVQSATDAITALSHAFGSLDPVRFVDHYLAKEHVRDIQRIAQDTTPALHEFQSMISSPTLRRIDVVLFEMVDVHGRGVFYDEVGALFDVGQNHLLQVLAEVLLARYMMMVQMSEKSAQVGHVDAHSAHDVHNVHGAPHAHDTQVTSSSIVRIPTKSEIIDHLHIVGTPVFGQYEGYVQEPGVNPDSDTETYVDVSVELMNSFHQTFKPYLQGITCRIASAKKAGYNASEIILHNDTGQNATIDMREGVDAYTYLFTHILTSPRISPQLFATPTEILSSWKFVMSVSEKKSKEQMVTYQRLPKV